MCTSDVLLRRTSSKWSIKQFIRHVLQRAIDVSSSQSVRAQASDYTRPSVRCNGSVKSADCVGNVMAHAKKPDFVFRRNGRVHLNRRGRQFSRLLAAEMCASAVVMLDTPCSEVVWRVLATHYIRQFPLHFPSRASPCAIMFQLTLPACHLTERRFHFCCLPNYSLQTSKESYACHFHHDQTSYLNQPIQLQVP